MESPAITAFTKILNPLVKLSKSRCETLAMLVLGVISARTVNLAHLAPERGAAEVLVASTYRRLQRFFQHVRLPQDWAAGVISNLAGVPQKRVLALDRTNWIARIMSFLSKGHDPRLVGDSHINILVLASVSPGSRVPLMWDVLDAAGNSGAADRIRLLDRYIATFGKQSIAMLLADREFIGHEWLNYLLQNDIPFTARMRGGMQATLADGRRTTLRTLLTTPRKGRRATATLTGLTAPLHLHAKTPKDREAVIVATNRTGHDALKTYRKRWGVELIFADSKTRGLNFEDTRLTDPDKLQLLTAIVAIAVAWANRAARVVLGKAAPVRKTHGYFEKSTFRTGFDFLRTSFRSDPEPALKLWKISPWPQIRERVV